MVSIDGAAQTVTYSEDVFPQASFPFDDASLLFQDLSSFNFDSQPGARVLHYSNGGTSGLQWIQLVDDSDVHNGSGDAPSIGTGVVA